MALQQTQEYKDYKREGKIYEAAERIIGVKNRLVDQVAAIEAIYAEVNADAGADADLKTLATQANNFVNNAKITDFITLVTNTLE